MIHIKQAIVVEGKYDRIRLATVVDALIIETGGFRIYKDEKKWAMLRKIAEEQGIVILTDSDGAGFQIRGFVRSILGEKADVTEVYIPDFYGKEKRKEAPSKEGKLGVEGMSEEVLYDAFQRAGLLKNSEKTLKKPPITTADFYEWGFTGNPNSREKRLALLGKLDFPEYLSGKALINALNALYSKEELAEALTQWELF